MALHVWERSFFKIHQSTDEFAGDILERECPAPETTAVVDGFGPWCVHVHDLHHIGAINRVYHPGFSVNPRQNVNLSQKLPSMDVGDTLATQATVAEDSQVMFLISFLCVSFRQSSVA